MIAVQCYTCGKPWEPERGDYVRGLWRTYPECRPGGAIEREDRDDITNKRDSLNWADPRQGGSGGSGGSL